MPRLPRAVIPGLPHHITQRGNNGQDVFFVDSDRHIYLDLLKEQAQRFDFRALGYCLMTNHVHLIGIPRRADSLAKAIGRTHWLYTQYVNRLHGRTGHLWQNRFFSCLLDEAHLCAALCYVERNPVRAKLVRRAWDYDWSSARVHVDGCQGDGLIDWASWQAMPKDTKWAEMLSKSEDEEALNLIRVRTRTGRPLGSDRFLAKMEILAGRRLRPLPVGRPRKLKRRKPKKRGGANR